MKYISAKADFPNEVKSRDNLFKAYKRIGEIDPYGIKRWTLKRSLYNEDLTRIQLSDKQLIKRGILNVRKRLNHHLGKSGKFTNTMLAKTAKTKISTSDSVNYIKASVPKKDYINIIVITYFLLWEYDQEYCQKLLEIEKKDIYPAKELNKQMPTKALVPIQTNIYIRSKGQTKEADDFFELIRQIVK